MPIPLPSSLRSQSVAGPAPGAAKSQRSDPFLEHRGLNNPSDTTTRLLNPTHSTTRSKGDLRRIEPIVLGLKGREWGKLQRQDRDRFLDLCCRYWTQRGFPYYTLTDEDIVAEYRRLEASSPERILVRNEIRMSMVGVRLANSFHPQMWAVPVRGARSPIERFHDQQKLRKLIRKALTIWPDRCAANGS